MKLKNNIFLIAGIVTLLAVLLFAGFKFNGINIYPSPTCSESETQYYYDGNGSIIKIDYGMPCDYGVKSINYFYDSNKNMIKELSVIKKDGLSYYYQIIYNYDSKNRMTKVVYPDVVEGYEYDSDDNIIKNYYIQNGVSYNETYSYVTLSNNGVNITKMGCVNCGKDASAPPEYYTYDGSGNLISHTTLGGFYADQTFNENGSLIEKCSVDGCADYNYNTDGSLTGIESSGFFEQNYTVNRCGSFDNYTYDGNCSLIKDNFYIYTYNSNLSLISKKEIATGKITRYQYDSSGRLIMISSPDQTTTYSYSNSNLYKLSESNSGTSYLSHADFNTLLDEKTLYTIIKSCSGSCGEIVINGNCSDGIKNGFETGIDCGLSCLNECEIVVPVTNCSETWSCGAWGACSGDIQTRSCSDSKRCDTTYFKPATTQSCTMNLFNNTIPGRGLIAYYDFEGVNNTEVVSNVSRMLTNVSQYIKKGAGKLGLGINLSYIPAGNRSGVAYGSVTNLSINTISLWFKTNVSINSSFDGRVSSQGGQVILIVGNGNIVLGSTTSLLANEIITIKGVNKTTGSTAGQPYTGWCNNNASITPNVWHSIVAVWNSSLNGTQAGYMIYYDNVRVDNCQAQLHSTGGQLGSTIANSVYIGGDSTRTLFNGQIDEVQFYAKTLNSSEIKWLYDFGKSNWNCSSWRGCVNGINSRTCLDLNNYNITATRPVISQNCNISYCLDSDKGINSSVFGTATYRNYLNGKADTSGTAMDSCVNDNYYQEEKANSYTLKEVYCYNFTNTPYTIYNGMMVVNSYINCSNGCSNGVCLTQQRCGDGFVNLSEECDSSNLNYKMCSSFGFSSGSLTCNSNCQFNVSGCVSPNIVFINNLAVYKSDSSSIANWSQAATICSNIGIGWRVQTRGEWAILNSSRTIFGLSNTNNYNYWTNESATDLNAYYAYLLNTGVKADRIAGKWYTNVATRCVKTI